MTDLKELRERVAKLEGPDREVDLAIGLAFDEVPKGWDAEEYLDWLRSGGYIVKDPLQLSYDPEPVTASIDAALGLAERLKRSPSGMLEDATWRYDNEFPANGKNEIFHLCRLTLLSIIDSFISQNTEAVE